MQSPTTHLSSIQQMKSKLRNDKQILMDIKNDFTKKKILNIPNKIPTSPNLFTIIAFIAAWFADTRVYQKFINKYEKDSETK